MADDDQRARPRVEQILHDGEHIGVEVVAGLVHDEHVRLIQQDQQQLHAALLSARQVADRRHQLRGFKAEPFHQLTGRDFLAVDDIAGLVAGQYFLDLVFAEFLQLVEPLRKHRELHGLADVDMPGCRRERAVDELEQRGFAGAVRADDAETVTGADQPGHVVENLATGDGDLLRRGGDLRRDRLLRDTLTFRERLRLRLGFRCGLDGFRHAGVHEARVGERVDGDFDGTGHARLRV